MLRRPGRQRHGVSPADGGQRGAQQWLSLQYPDGARPRGQEPGPARGSSQLLHPGAAVCHPHGNGLLICGQHQLLSRPALYGHPSPRLRHPAAQEKRGVGPPHQPRRVSGRDDASPRTSLRRAGRRHAGLGLPHGVCQPDGEAPLRRRAQRHEEHTVYLRRQQKRQHHQSAHAAARSSTASRYAPRPAGSSRSPSPWP